MEIAPLTILLSVLGLAIAVALLSQARQLRRLTARLDRAQDEAGELRQAVDRFREAIDRSGLAEETADVVAAQRQTAEDLRRAFERLLHESERNGAELNASMEGLSRVLEHEGQRLRLDLSESIESLRESTRALFSAQTTATDGLRSLGEQLEDPHSGVTGTAESLHVLRSATERIAQAAAGLDAEVSRAVASLSKATAAARGQPSSPPVEYRVGGRPAIATTAAVSDGFAIDLGTTNTCARARMDRPAGEPSPDSVECSLFSVREVRPGDALFIQVFAHREEDRSEAVTAAREFDRAASRRLARALDLAITRGSVLSFELRMNGVTIDEPIEEITWTGRTKSVQFDVEVPSDFSDNILRGKVLMACDGIPAGTLKFMIDVHERARPVREQQAEACSEARPYELAFVSYASSDRDEVLRRVQMLSVMKVTYFQDVLTLEPGDRWKRKLYEYIDRSDLFLLFWSRAAKESEWVMKEVRYALERKGGLEDEPPEIIPVIIEKPAPDPPADLRDVHFNDRILYFMDEPSPGGAHG